MIPPLFALLSWPALLAVSCNGRSVGIMVCVSVIGGYLFLPVEGGLDLPLLPALDKNLIPALAAMIGASMMASNQRDPLGQPGWLPGHALALVLMALVIIGSFVTVITNRDPVFFVLAGILLPGLQFYDAFSYVLSSMMLLLPILLGRKFLADPAGHRLLLVALCVAALIYSPLVLYEVRMSPQLSAQIYGFFPHSWIQHIRGDGYRPIVFFEHGLRLAIFLAAAMIATAGLSRVSDPALRGKYLLALLWLTAVLIVAKSLGALIIAVIIVAVIMLLPTRVQMTVAAVLVAMVILYPITRSAELIPIDWMLQTINGIDLERAASLEIRFVFEGLLLDRAQERSLFGWGGNGRSLLQTEPTIPDGQWVITLGKSGWTGFIALFGLLSFPILLLWWSRKRFEIGPETVILSLVLAGSIVDLIPNSGMNPIIWLMAGALWGRLELGKVTDQADAPPTEVKIRETRYKRPGRARPTDQPVNVYTRQKNRTERKSQ